MYDGQDCWTFGQGVRHFLHLFRGKDLSLTIGLGGIFCLRLFVVILRKAQLFMACMGVGSSGNSYNFRKSSHLQKKRKKKYVTIFIPKKSETIEDQELRQPHEDVF